jgi:hypothetical protein
MIRTSLDFFFDSPDEQGQVRQLTADLLEGDIQLLKLD